MSKTPRTDTLVERHGVWSPARLLSAYEQLAVHARQLERELASVRTALDARTRGIKAIAAHWREFGPDHGFDEVVETVAYAVELSDNSLMSAHPANAGKPST